MANFNNNDNEPVSAGNIYINNYKQNKSHPDFTGTIVLQKSLLKEIVSKLKEHNQQEVEVGIACWDRISKNGNAYKYAKMEMPRGKKADPEPVVDDINIDDLNEDDIPF